MFNIHVVICLGSGSNYLVFQRKSYRFLDLPGGNSFPAENAGNMPEKPVFWPFSRDFIISFS